MCLINQSTNWHSIHDRMYKQHYKKKLLKIACAALSISTLKQRKEITMGEKL